MILVLVLIIGSRQPETDLTLKDFRALGVRNLKVCFHSRVCISNIQDQGKLVEAESQSLNSVTLWISYQNDAMIFHEGTLTFKTPLIWGLDQLLFIKQNPIKSSDIHVWFDSTFHSVIITEVGNWWRTKWASLYNRENLSTGCISESTTKQHTQGDI